MHDHVTTGENCESSSYDVFFKGLKELSDRVNSLENWKMLLVGGGLVALSFVIPMFTWYLIKIDSKVEKMYEIFNSSEIIIQK
jgi:hypothetical protein